MASIADSFTEDISEGLEEGLWGAAKGALFGYMVLPALVGLAVGLAFGTGAIGAGVIGLESISIGGAAAVGAAATAITAVVGYPINKFVAKWVGIAGGLLGFIKGVEEPDHSQGQSIQLGKDQQLIVVNREQAVDNEISPNVATTHKAEALSSHAPSSDIPHSAIQAHTADHLAERVSAIVRHQEK